MPPLLSTFGPICKLFVAGEEVRGLTWWDRVKLWIAPSLWIQCKASIPVPNGFNYCVRPKYHRGQHATHDGCQFEHTLPSTQMRCDQTLVNMPAMGDATPRVKKAVKDAQRICPTDSHRYGYMISVAQDLEIALDKREKQLIEVQSQLITRNAELVAAMEYGHKHRLEAALAKSSGDDCLPPK